MDNRPRLPDFFIIGAAKCGTTDLASLLDKHPTVRLGKVKEPSFFCRDDLDQDVVRFLASDPNYWRTLDWEAHLDVILREYGRNFEDIPSDVLAFEASAWYFLSRKAPGRIHEMLPNTKLIAVLREPARRLVSEYWFRIQQGSILVDPEDYFYTKQAADGVRWGLYKEHLTRWLSFFPRDQLHVILFEEYVSPHTRQEVVDGVCRFLGVERTLDATRTETDSNRSGVPRWSALERWLNLVRLRYRLPGTTSLDHQIRRPSGRKHRLIHAIVNRISAMNISYNRRHPAWPPELLERVRAYYRYENAGLSELIGRDVDAIWYGRKEGAALPDRPLAVAR
jgi:hypothetical protein